MSLTSYHVQMVSGHTCTAGRPFDPITLLTPFQENCKKPLAPSIYANANALAAQDPAISPTTAPHLSSTTRGGNTDDTQPSSVPAAPPPASIMTTTYIGIATHPNGAQETYTVPALVGPTRTIFGSPVTKAPGTAKPTSTVTLPWSIPAPASSTKHSTTLATSSARAPSLTSSSSSPTTASGTSKTGTGASGNDGTVLDADNSSVLQHSAGSSLLGLMIVVLVAVIWF
ncbi:MAG: hypothetical protein LQ352_006893 [Teloschistes flavicans]|nr:MAG: hypothetical protein LQ352_006893 [Teloschistes flavicans]